MINHKFISFSAVQIYDLSYIHLHAHDYHAQSCTLEKPDDFPQNKQTNNFTKTNNRVTAYVSTKTYCKGHWFKSPTLYRVLTQFQPRSQGPLSSSLEKVLSRGGKREDPSNEVDPILPLQVYTLCLCFKTSPRARRKWV